MPGQAPWTGWTGHCRRPGRTGCHRTRLPRTENPRARMSSDGRRWIAADTRPGRVSQGYWVLWVLLVDWAEEEHAGQGTGAAGRTIGRGLLIRGFRVRV